MANRYWVGGTGTWDGTDTTYWSTSSGGAGGTSVPTSVDDVFIDANSGGGTIDIDSSAGPLECASLNFTGFTGATTSVSNGTLDLYGDLTFSETVATYDNWTARFVADATMHNDPYTITSLDTVNIVVDNGYKLTLGGIFHVASIRLMASSWFFSDSNDFNAVYIESVSGNNIFDISGSYISASFVTIKSTDTVYADYSLFNMTASFNNLSELVWDFKGGGHTYGYLNIVYSSVTGAGVTGHGIFDSNTFRTIAGYSPGVNTVEFEAGTTQTIIETFSLAGTYYNSITFRSMTPGSQFTLYQAVGITSVDYVILKDSAATGGAIWYAGANSTDDGNNSGWIFTAQPAVNRYWVGGTGTWDTVNTTHWSATSGGAGGVYAPTSLDAVFIDANSGGGTITLDYNVSIGSLDCTGFTGTLTSSYSGLNLSGNLTLDPAGTYTYWYAIFLTPATLTCNGAITPDLNIAVYSDGILTLNGDISVATFELNSFGTLITDNFNVTVNYIYGSGSENSTFNFGSSLITASYVYIRPGDTVNAGTCTFNMNNAVNSSPYNWEFYGGGHTYYNLNFSSNSATSAAEIDGYPGGVFDNNTFYAITSNVQPINVAFQSGSTQTITDTFGVAGTAGNLVTLFSDASGTQFTLSKASGTVSADYLSLQDSAATGGAAWYAGANSTDVSNNTGWTFTAPPSPGAQSVSIGGGITIGGSIQFS